MEYQLLQFIIILSILDVENIWVAISFMNIRRSSNYSKNRLSLFAIDKTSHNKSGNRNRSTGKERPVGRNERPKIGNEIERRQFFCGTMLSSDEKFRQNVLRKAESIRSSQKFQQLCSSMKKTEKNELLSACNQPLLSFKSLEKLDRSKKIYDGSINSFLSDAGSELASFRIANKLRNLRRRKEVCHFKDNAKCSEGRNWQDTSVCSLTEDQRNFRSKRPFSLLDSKINIKVNGNDEFVSNVATEIKQSFSTLDSLESKVDRAAKFLKASFSKRLSYNVSVNCETISKSCSESENEGIGEAVNSFAYKLKPENLTRGKLFSCRLNSHIAYGKRLREMNEHLRQSREFALKCKNDREEGYTDAKHTDDQLSRNYDVVTTERHSLTGSHSTDLLSSENLSIDRQSTLYASARKRIKQVLGRTALNHVEVPPYSDEVMDAVHRDILENPPPAIAVNDNACDCSEREFRECYIQRTLNALRQLFRDETVYYIKLRRLCRNDECNEDKSSKIAGDEDRVRAICFALKRRYLKTLEGNMTKDQFRDYHINETTQLQLCNASVRRKIALLSDQTTLYHKQEKPIKDAEAYLRNYEKMRVAARTERRERKSFVRLQNHLKNNEVMSGKSDISISVSSEACKVLNNEAFSRKALQNENNHLEQLRDDLEIKRKEADALRSALVQRVNVNILREESSLQARIDAHKHYITETKKDMHELDKIEGCLTECGSSINRESTFLSGPPHDVAHPTGAVLHSFISSDNKNDSSKSSVSPTKKDASSNSSNTVVESNKEATEPPVMKDIDLLSSGQLFKLRDVETIIQTTAVNTNDVDNVQALSSCINAEDKNFNESLTAMSSAHAEAITSDKSIEQLDNLKSELPVDGLSFTPFASAESREFLNQSFETEGSFHTTHSSFSTAVKTEDSVAIDTTLGTEQVKNESLDNEAQKQTEISLPAATDQRKRSIKLSSNPLVSPRSARFPGSFSPNSSSPRDVESQEQKKSDACVSPLATSFMEMVLDDSLNAVLDLVNNKENIQKIVPKSIKNSSRKSFSLSDSLGDESFDLSKIPVPKNLIPGLDLSAVEADAESANDKSAPSVGKAHAEESELSVEFDSEFADLKAMFLSNSVWIRSNVEQISQQIYDLVTTEQPLAVELLNVEGESLNETSLRSLLTDRCCEIASRLFISQNPRRYMGLDVLSFYRPRNVHELATLLVREINKQLIQDDLQKDQKRWERLSRGANDSIENFVLEEMYEGQEGWRNCERYTNEIKEELVAEVMRGQIDQSFRAVI